MDSPVDITEGTGRDIAKGTAMGSPCAREQSRPLTSIQRYKRHTSYLEASVVAAILALFVATLLLPR